MIPFVEFFRNEKFKEEIKEACYRVIDRKWFILGSELKEFEKEFANYCNKEYGIGVGNGTDAITLSLNALGIERGDEVITAANTAIPTVAAIVNCGAKPVLADVGKDYLIDPQRIEEAITDKTRAIIPVHLYGRPCDMNSIMKIAENYAIPVLEDCAQAHGAEYKSKKVPFGEIGCFSFYPSKNLGAIGDGGMIVTSNKNLEDKIRLLRNYGQSDRYHAKIHGENSRLDEIQAAVLRVGLKYLDNFNDARKKNAGVYDSLLDKINGVITPPKNSEEIQSVYHLYVIRSNKRDELMNCLKEKEISTAIHYPIPIHLQEAYKNMGYKKDDFPNAEKYAEEIISLPMFPELKREEIEEVAKEIKSFHSL